MSARCGTLVDAPDERFLFQVLIASELCEAAAAAAPSCDSSHELLAAPETPLVRPHWTPAFCIAMSCMLCMPFA